MAALTKENSQMSDGDGNPLIGVAQDAIADSTVTATLTGVDTGTDMTTAQAATIVADLTDLSTKLNAVIAALEEHGLIKAA